jgi:hypothetical protein
MAGMLAALVGPPAAMLSIALVLESVSLQQQQMQTQQNQYEEMIERENSRLDPHIEEIEYAAAPSLMGDTLGGRSFHLTVTGDVSWFSSTFPGGPNAVAVKRPDGKIELLLWKKRPIDTSFRGFVNYRRPN